MSPGKVLIVLGAVLIAAGLVVLLLERAPLRIGQLPLDIVWRGKNVTVYIPLGLSILASVVLTFLFWLIGRR